jgi:GntR family transcriptional regulator, carbon starvation induced regulator
MTEADFVDLTMLRREIEVLALTRSVQRGDDAWEADMVRAFHHMSLASASVSNNFPLEWSRRQHQASARNVKKCGSLIQSHIRVLDVIVEAIHARNHGY